MSTDVNVVETEIHAVRDFASLQVTESKYEDFSTWSPNASCTYNTINYWS